MTLRGKISRLVPARLAGWLRRRADGQLAAPGDLRACYRLLLGREPDPQGWETFAPSVRRGEVSRRNLVTCFLRSPEFQGRLAELSPSAQAPATADTGDFRLFVAPADSAIGRALLRHGAYEPHVTARFRERVRPGATVVDVGANLGYFSLLAARLAGAGGRVVAVEPGQHNCALLEASARLNGFDTVDVFPFAAAEGAGSTVFDEVDGNGVISPPGEGMPAAGRTLVRTVALDWLLRDEERVDVIKIDVEGAEHRALLGAAETIARHRPVIFTEFSPGALANVSGVTGEAYLDALASPGYRLAVIRERPAGELVAGSPGDILRLLEESNRDHLDLLAEPGPA